MSGPDLAQSAVGLFSVADADEPRSLNQLAAMAVRQVPACCGAAAGLWHRGELAVLAASHPDLPELIDAQVRCGRGPVLDALADGGPVSSADTLAEDRWPRFAAAALRRGVRCSVDLAYRSGTGAVTLSLFGARPRRAWPGELAVAELLTAFGAALMGNLAQYGDARRTAIQLRAAAESRTIVNQAKGMLMQAFGCSADDALGRMRQISQAHNLKVTEVASRIIAAGGLPGPGWPAPGPPRRAGQARTRDRNRA